MDKALVKAAIGKVRALSMDDAAKLSYEEAGLLQLYRDSRLAEAGDIPPAEQGLLDTVGDMLDAWKAKPIEPARTQEDNRRDHNLRASLQKLQAKQYDALSRGELVLLRSTLKALQQRSLPDVAAGRLHALLESLLGAYARNMQAAKQAGGPPIKPRDDAVQPEKDSEDAAGDGGMAAADRTERPKGEAISLSSLSGETLPPAADGTVRRVDADDLFNDRPRRQIYSVEGMEANMIARLYQVDGDTEIEGDVPDTALLVVRDGSVKIRGVVEGSVVASRGIEVEGNVAGRFVVAKGGDIKARKALMRSQLIAAEGKLELEDAEHATCLFAFDHLYVAGDVVGCKMVARSIEVGGAVTGSEMHAVGEIKTGPIKVTEHRGSVVCLRNLITCEDYGAPMERADRALHRSVGKHTHTARVLSHYLQHAGRDIRDAHRTMLYYLLGVGGNANDVRILRGLQCQQNFLASLAETGERLGGAVRAVVQAEGDVTELVSRKVIKECKDSVDPIHDECETLASSYEMANKGIIIKGCRTLSALAAKALAQKADAETIEVALTNLEKSAARWRNLAGELREEVDKCVARFQIDASLVERIEQSGDRLEDMLNQVLKQVASEPNGERYQRTKSSVMRLMQTRVDRGRKNMETWREQLSKTRYELSAVMQSLDQNRAFIFARPKESPTRLLAPAIDDEVAIVSNPAPGTDPRTSAEHMVVLKKSLKEPSVFSLVEGTVRNTTHQ